MDLLDLIIILICVGFAISGYRQGFVVGVMSFIGFVGGLLIGVWLVPDVMRRFQSSLVVSTISLCAVLALAVLGQVLACLFLLFMLTFIAGVCAMAWLCAFFRSRSNGYAQRYRDVAGRAKSERRRTIIETPAHSDPLIVGDVSQAQWPKGRFPASRPNIVRGEG